MVHQIDFEFNKYWFCLEAISLGFRPVFGKQEDMIYFYWLVGGVQVGRQPQHCSG